jgi:hypothetical protein
MEQLKSDVISDAYSQMRISGLTVNPSSQDLELALMRMENMFAEFAARNVCTGYNAEDEPDPNSVTNLPAYAKQMAATNLATRLIPDFNKVVPMQLMALASGSYSTVSAVAQKEILNQVSYPRRMPRGSGSTLRYNRWQRFYRNAPNAPAECATNNMSGGDVNDFIEHFDAYLAKDEFISTFTIEATDDLTIASSSNSNQDVLYRVEAANQSTTSSTGYQSVEIVITTDSGRVEKRLVNFQLTD